MIDKKLMEEYLTEVAKTFPNDEKMMRFLKGDVAVIVRLTNGGLFPVRKERIKRDFCFGYDDYGRDYADAEALRCFASKSEEYFTKKNLGSYTRVLEAVQSESGGVYLCRAYSRPGDSNIYAVLQTRPWEDPWVDAWRISDQDRAIIIGALTEAIELQKKKIGAYLKRYGLSKVNTWTYWAD